MLHLCNFYPNKTWKFQDYLLTLPAEREGPAQVEEALCSKLAEAIPRFCYLQKR